MTDEVADYYSTNARVYPVLARVYDLAVLPLVGLRDEVVRISGAAASSRVIDVATGTGAQANAFAKRGASVIGVDISDAMLEVARRKHPNVTFEHADATALPFEASRFDVACVSFALHEMPPSIRERVLGEMARVTKPNGTVVIVDYGFRPFADRLIRLYERDHYAEFVRSDLRGLLARKGLAIEAEHLRLRGVVRIVRASRRP